MGFLDRFTSSTNDNAATFWNPLTSDDQVQDVILQSNERPQVILKHSNHCGTSFFAKKNLETLSQEKLEGADRYIIDVIGSRSLSRQFAEIVGVRHESPQLLIIKNGAVTWHGSHHLVNADNLMEALR